MKCHICDLTNVTLHRQNEKGVQGIWACDKHNKIPLSEDDQKLIKVLEESAKESGERESYDD